MSFKVLFIWIGCIILTNCVYAQEQTATMEEIVMELLGEEMSDDVDISEIIERLNYYQRHPIDINSANEGVLTELTFLSAQQIANILEHRRHSGDFISLLELQSISGLDLRTIEFLTEFITIRSLENRDVSVKDVMTNSDQSIMVRYAKVLERQHGYTIEEETRSRYLGDANRYAVRYRLNYDNYIKISINAEKDAGEPFFKEKQQYGFDFYSGNIEWNPNGRIVQKVVIGDYALQFGQGLIAWNGLSFGKGAQLQSIARQAQGIRAYTSMNEQNFMRGIALDLRWNRISWKPFFAYNHLSGNVEEDSLGNKLINTINESGLHRTPTELSYRNAIGQLVVGSNVNAQLGRFTIGMTHMTTKFMGDKIRGDDLRQQYDFQGNILHQFGVNYQFNYRNYFVYGETAITHDFAWATTNGIIATLDPKLSLFAHYRNYQRDYHQFFARAIGESSNVVNEEGVLAGLQYTLVRKLEWSGYVDIFKFPWLRYRVDAPSAGADILSQLSYLWHKKGKLSLRYRYRLKEENVSIDGRPENFIAQVFRNQLRAEFQYKLDNIWTIRSRVEYSRYDKELSHKSQGYLLYQDVFWKTDDSKISSNIRIAYFNTDDYDARIYAYESDVLYGASFPMYYDKGWRYYLNVRYRINRSLDLWGRFAQTIYNSRESIGSGLDLIEGNKKSEIKIQLRWRW